MLSLLAVFRDILPSYRIRLPTDKEAEMAVRGPPLLQPSSPELDFWPCSSPALF
jgi:hypothetical protein